MARQKVIPAIAERVVNEDIHAFTVSEDSVAVAVGDRDAEGNWSRPFETIIVVGPDFEDLMAADGNGNTPGKPAGTFRKEDLWPFIDRVRGRKTE